ncbi:MAG: response regulator transcription factor [Pseudomonadota bacterium]
MIRVVIAEDQAMLRGALATLLSLEDDIELVADAADGLSALDAVQEHEPDVLITDIEMPGASGIEIAERIRDARSQTRVLIVTTFSRPGYLQRALNAGVAGYVLKDSSSDALATAVRAVARGERHVPAELAELAWTTPDPLTERERQVLQLAESGLANKQIAAELGLSDGTVRNYLTEAMDKLQAGNRVEAFRRARDLGWL